MKDTRVDFLYLNEKDMIRAGVLDAGKCVDVVGEVQVLLSEGDFLMGGPNKNDHGICIMFPKESAIENFPVYDAKDRRFMAMPAYLGGRFHIAGQKWYGSNSRNKTKGLPRSILTVTLNDVETGAPLVHMSANLLSAMRTGAMPGLAASLLAKPDSHVLAIIGPGVVNRACLMSILAKLPGIDTVRIKGSTPLSENTRKMRELIARDYPQIRDVIVCETNEECVRDADIVSEACSFMPGQFEHFEPEWFKKGCVIISSGSMDFDDPVMAESFTKVVDNIAMYENYQHEFQTFDEDGNRIRSGCIGLYFVNMRDDEMILTSDIHTLGNILRKKEPARVSDDEIFLVGVGGMPVLDVAWGYECWKSAIRQNIGTSLNLWEEPALF